MRRRPAGPVKPSTEYCWASQHETQHETPVAYGWGRQSQLWVEFGVVYNGSCKPQSCQKQKTTTALPTVMMVGL